MGSVNKESKKVVSMSEEQYAQLVASLKEEIKSSVIEEIKAERAQNSGKRSTGKIQQRVYDILEDPELQHLTYKEIAEKVSIEFSSNTTAGCISWYISHKSDYKRNPLPRKKK
jgi:hypothetical protein